MICRRRIHNPICPNLFRPIVFQGDSRFKFVAYNHGGDRKIVSDHLLKNPDKRGNDRAHNGPLYLFGRYVSALEDIDN
jgi:hypothetical protein